MERLTCRDRNGFVELPFEYNGVNGSYDIEDVDLLEEQMERLAAIEDILGDHYDLGRLRALLQKGRQ